MLCALGTALANAIIPLASDGTLFVSIYDHRGYISRYWKRLKRFHNKSGRAGKLAVEIATLLITGVRCIPFDIAGGKPFPTVRTWKEYGQES
jgi:hypothetical protein